MPDFTWLRVGRGPRGHQTGPRGDGRGSPPLAGLTHHVLHRGPFPENDGVREVWPLCTGWGVGGSQQSQGAMPQGFSLQGPRALPFSTGRLYSLDSTQKIKTHPHPGADPCKTVSRESPGQGDPQENLDWTSSSWAARLPLLMLTAQTHLRGVCSGVGLGGGFCATGSLKLGRGACYHWGIHCWAVSPSVPPGTWLPVPLGPR